MAGKKLGYNAKLWVKAGETDPAADISGAAPASATEWTHVQDVTVSDSFSEVDVTTRRMGGSKAYKQGLRDISVQVPHLHDTDDAAVDILNTAMANRSVVTVWILDGPVDSADSEGIAFVGEVFGGDENQELDGPIGKTLTIKPTDGQYKPSAITNTIT